MNDFLSNTALKTLQNFDLSVVISLDEKQWTLFVQLFPSMVGYYQRNGVEVVLVCNHISDTDMEAFIKRFPMIDWRVIEASFGNPMTQINTGIRQSVKKYIVILNPEWKFQCDVIYFLRRDLDSYPEYYAVGEVNGIGYGGIMVRKEYLEKINGLDETCTDRELGYENLRRRMELAGIRKLFHQEATLTIHDAHQPSNTKKAMTRKEYDWLLPVKATANNDQWGGKPNKIVYDWRDKPFAAEQCKDYLAGLVDYQILNPDVFNRDYQLIALIPTYQESERITDCLRSVEKHCDGIIVLDDESTDNTYELVQSEKLLLKARKKRTEFNDKQNRNILLDLAYFFRSEWFIFIDADERFDERFVDLPQAMQSPVDVVGVWIANLWDSMDTYRTNMGDSNQISQNGLWFRWRMFRNKGRMQIVSKNKLHFNSVPYLTNLHISQLLLLHLGYIDREKRDMKYRFYKEEDDMDLFGYYDILKLNIMTRNIDLIMSVDLISDYPIGSNKVEN